MARLNLIFMYRIVLSAVLWLFATVTLSAQRVSIEDGDVFENGNICLDVSVEGFMDIISMEFSLRWDSTVLSFSSVSSITGLADFNDSRISDPTETSPNTPKNLLLVTWNEANLTPQTLPDGDILFQVCFDAIGPLGSSSTMNLFDLEFFDSNLNPVDFSDRDGIVNITNSAGDNLTFDFPTTSGDSSEILCIPLTVSNFDTISSFSFGVKWDATVLSFQNLDVPMNLQGFSASNISIIGADSLSINWQDIDNSGESLPPGTVLFELCVRLVGAPARSSTLFIGNVTASRPSGPVQDLTANNGLVIIDSPPIAPDFRLSASDQTVMPGDDFCVPVRVGGFENIDAFNFEITWDNTVLDYTTTADFAALNGFDLSSISTNGFPISGISVNWTDPDNMGRDLFFNTQLFRVCFEATGGAGTSSEFNLLNATASNGDGLPVTEILNDAEITISNPSQADVIFQLDTLNLANGDNGCLILTVEDFDDIQSASFDINWNNQGLSFLSSNILTNIPGLDNSNITDPLSGGSDGTLNLTWQDDNNVGRTLAQGAEFLEICFQADAAGINRVLSFDNISVENTNVSLDVNGVGRIGLIEVEPDGSSSNFELDAGDVSIDLGSDGCFPVRVRNFDNLITLEFQMSWNGAIFSFDRIENVANLSGFSTANISSPGAGSLILSWDDSDLSGESLSDNTILFEICGNGLQNGTTNSMFSNEEATDADNNLVSVLSDGGLIEVSDGGSGGTDLEIYARNESIDVGDQICTPIRVRNFSELITAELRLSFDENILLFDQLQNIAAIDDLQASSFSMPPDNGTDNLILLSWLHNDLSGQSLPDDAVLFEVCFTGLAPGTSVLNLFSSEFADNNNMTVPATLTDGSIVVGGTPPAGLTITADEKTASPGSKVCVPVEATSDFEDMITMEMSLGWDDTVLEFDEITIPGTLPFLTASAFSMPPDNGTSDMVFLSWLDNDLVGKSLADGTELFSVCYNVIGSNGDQSSIDLMNAEFSNAAGDLVPAFLDDGRVTVGNSSNTDLELSVPTNSTVDPNQEICIPVRVSGFSEITELSFNLNWDDTRFTFSSIQNLAVLNDLDNSDFTTPSMGGSSGSISLSWTDQDNSGESLQDNAILFELCLNAMGNEGEVSDLQFSNVASANASGGNVNTTENNGQIRINNLGGPGLRFYMTDKTVDLGDEVCIPVRVNDFEDILSMEFNIDYDPTKLQFDRITDLAGLPSYSTGQFSTPSAGLIILTWLDDLDLSGESLVDGDTLFSMCFNTLEAGTTNVNFTFDEVADSGNNLLNPDLINGTITIEGGNQGGGDLIFEFADVQGDSGTQLCVPLSVEEFTNVANAGFTLNWDGNIISFSSVNITGSLNGLDDNSILDPIEDPGLGSSLIFDWDNPGGLNASLPSPSELFEVCFDLIGNPGELSILNISGVSAQDENNNSVPAVKSDGSVRINAVDGADVLITAGNANGKTGDNICIDVTVKNFTDILTAEFIVEWDPSVMQFTEVTNLASLPDLSAGAFGTPSQTGTPGLLTFNWFDNNLNLHSLPDDAILFSVCFDLIGLAGSSSAVRLRDLEFSTGTGQEVPSTNVDGLVMIDRNATEESISFDIANGSVNPGEEICIPVSTSDFVNINSLNLDFEWDPSIIEFSRVEIVAQVNNLDPTDFNSVSGLLNLSWMDPQAVTLNDGDVLFRICFNAIGPAASSSQVFISNGEVLNQDGVSLNILADNGRVQLNDILAINSITIDSISCNGDNNGSIAISVTGGSGNYMYAWNPAVSSGPQANNLGSGTYSVTITDGSGGMLVETITLNEPPLLEINPTITGVNPPASNGEIDLNISGGTPPYSIQWCCNLDADQEIQSMLSEGIYSATITDDKGCMIETGDMEINGLLFAQVVVTDSTSCSDSNDGSVGVLISGGIEPYQITWTDGMNIVGVTDTVNGLGAGTYNYTITDAGNPPQMITGSAVIGSPPPIMIDFNISPETNAGGDGSIIIDVTGGTPNYTYSWFNYQNNNVSTNRNQFNLETGYLSLAIQDANFCIMRFDSIFVGPAIQVPQDSIIVDSITCPGKCDAEISLFPTGGTGEYIYSWDGGGSTTENSRDGLCSGERIIIVEDLNNGDVVVVRVILEEPEELDVTTMVVGVSSGNDGQIILDISGGTQPYNYDWSNGEMTRDISNLTEGIYSVTITDANGCETIIENIEVDAQTLTLDILDVQDVDCAGDSDGSVNIELEGGCEPYTFVWRRDGLLVGNTEDLSNVPSGIYELQVIDNCNAVIFSGEIFIDALSNMNSSANILTDYNGFDVSGADKQNGGVRLDITGGVGTYDYNWSNGSMNSFATDLAAGPVFVTVTDDLGCILIDTIVLTAPDFLTMSFTIINENDCFNDQNGVVGLVLSGGVSPYDITWENGESGPTATMLPTGFNAVTIVDQNNNILEDSVFINSNSQILIDSIIRPDFGSGEGAITLIVSGGSAPYDFQWDDIDNSTTSSLSGLIAGIYNVVITDHMGCTQLLTLRVPLQGSAPECLESREVFTPNSDGQNDFFVINCIEQFENSIQIFNRWGDIVFEQENYDNFWNGRNQEGEVLPQGAYFFVLNFINDEGQKEVMKGHISIIR